eukprot:5010337-Prymnesium_polylepis.1
MQTGLGCKRGSDAIEARMHTAEVRVSAAQTEERDDDLERRGVEQPAPAQLGGELIHLDSAVVVAVELLCAQRARDACVGTRGTCGIAGCGRAGCGRAGCGHAGVRGAG